MSRNWASHAIEALQEGETCQIRPRGNSMKPKVKSGQLVTLEPVETEDLQKGDIVLVKVSGRVYLHLIKAIDGARFQIANNRGHVNGWVGSNCIFGKATKIED